MSTTRVMNGLVNMEGSKVNTLHVGDLVARRPEPTYRTTCQRCGTVATAPHSRLRSGAAVCLFSGCGNIVKPARERLNEHRQEVAEREAQRIADERRASELRMDVETEGHEVKRNRFVPEPGPMSDRDRRSIHEYREAEESAQRAAEAPRLKAERQAAQDREAADAVKRDREDKQRAYWSDWVSTDRDPKFFISPSLASASMSRKDAAAHNAAEVEKFTSSVPEYAAFKTPANANIILDYMSRNGVTIYDAATLKAAFIRLRDLGLVKQKQAATQQPLQTEPEQADMTYVPTAPSTAAHQAPQTFRGRDQVTGEMRGFTKWEVDHMSADLYKRTFGALESFSELFSTR